MSKGRGRRLEKKDDQYREFNGKGLQKFHQKQYIKGRTADAFLSVTSSAREVGRTIETTKQNRNLNTETGALLAKSKAMEIENTGNKLEYPELCTVFIMLS